MNKSVLITGANAGIGKDTARQLAMLNHTEKIYLACRNRVKAEEAKKDLEEKTGRKVFEIIVMDVSNLNSVRNAVMSMNEPVDALIMNAGGMGGKTPEKITSDGVTQITATNLLGHVYLLDEMIKYDKLKKTALFASSEAARGIEKTGMKRPSLKTSSVKEFKEVFNGKAFGNDFDAMQVYGVIKYGGTMWMSSMARKHPHLRFISMSPGGTRGTQGFDDMPLLQRIMFKYIGMPIFMPLLGLSHSLEKGASRFVEGINNPAFKSGIFYGSKKNVLTGKLVDQSSIFSDLSNQKFQDNAYEAIRSFLY
ncbi:SDR family NAD(P)-dependent oxidoreductase [Aureibacter tunicatorum]|uniref:NAD(P)-dependent dehydrogenase (Short-subunit alcohol dehydrogenase family) n=1 Tax=Aureibacter tunicatorum TaxID=866807 RepID=A0AAE3XSL3_9BACT|nr:SDR family NAD(P)-dependent oxidoreductase [Aureibacter tunicatorum]MDR6241343.1 NAD(P)-dependent dehydrogenase (short-subunit alcohol dehydrogenase family) [Aureibacter tunicatorum]BDD03602.1 oxidoreductase [Aureibacter tunicatorum]